MAAKESKFSRWLYSRPMLKTWLMVFIVSLVLLAFGLTGIIGQVFPKLDLTHFISAKTFSAKVRVTVVKLSRLVTIDFIVLGIGLLGILMAVRRGTYAFLTIINPGRKNGYINSVYRHLRLKRGPKIVVFGGASGIVPLLEGLSSYTENISVISFPEEAHLLSSLAALSGSNKRMRDLLGFRFGSSGLKGESFGGLFLDAMRKESGGLENALDESSRVLSLSGRVVPATFERVELALKSPRVKAKSPSKPCMPELILKPSGVKANPEAVRVIYSADALVIGPGSFYSELLPFFLLGEIKDAVVKSKCAKLLVSNIMTRKNGSDGEYLSDQVRKILDQAGHPFLHYCVVNEGPVPEDTLIKYSSEGSCQVKMDWDEVDKLGVKIIRKRLIRLDESGLARHDAQRLGRAVIKAISI